MATFNKEHHARLMAKGQFILAGLVADRKIELGSDLAARQNANRKSFNHFYRVRVNAGQPDYLNGFIDLRGITKGSVDANGVRIRG